MSKKVILMILNQRFLPDPRVQQEYDELTKVGYRVVVVAHLKGGEQKGYEVLRVDPYKGISRQYNFSLWRNPKLERDVVNKLSAIGIEQVHAVHVHDLFWSFLGLRLGKVFSAKLVIDLHENYPALIEDLSSERFEGVKQSLSRATIETIKNPWNGAVRRLVHDLCVSPSRLRRYELRMLQACDRFVVVVDEALERFRDEPFYSKGVVVSNTKNPLIWQHVPVRKIGEKMVITYVGTVQDLRGLDTAILAMRFVDQAKFELNIVGVVYGSTIHEKFVGLLQRYSITNVNLVEWLTVENAAFKFIDEAHVCIVPHKRTDLTESTVPHKLFMYMAKGRPVLVSDVAPLKRIVETAKNGLVFEADNSQDLAAKMREIFDDELLLHYSINGRAAAERQFNWKHDRARLLNMYEEIFCELPGRRLEKVNSQRSASAC